MMEPSMILAMIMSTTLNGTTNDWNEQNNFCLFSIRHGYFSAEAGYLAIRARYWRIIVPCNGILLNNYDYTFQIFQFQFFQLKYEKQNSFLKII